MVREKPKHRITVTLNKDVFKSISKMAIENDVSIARVIRFAVDNLLKERREGHQQQLVLPFSSRTV